MRKKPFGGRGGIPPQDKDAGRTVANKGENVPARYSKPATKARSDGLASESKAAGKDRSLQGRAARPFLPKSTTSRGLKRCEGKCTTRSPRPRFPHQRGQRVLASRRS